VKKAQKKEKTWAPYWGEKMEMGELWRYINSAKEKQSQKFKERKSGRG